MTHNVKNLVLFALVAAAIGATFTARVAQAEKPDAFSSATIDLGVVVSDVNKAVKFYTEAVGFTEAKGFKVSADFAAEAGLIDPQDKGELDIHVLVLGEGDKATKLKLMEFPNKKAKKNDNQTINSELGFRYLTIHITDTNAAMERLKKAGVKPLGKGPAGLPASLAQGVFLTVVQDPDGNLVELVGPKK